MSLRTIAYVQLAMPTLTVLSHLSFKLEKCGKRGDFSGTIDERGANIGSPTTFRTGYLTSGAP